MIRPAIPEDREAVEAIVCAAYEAYIPRIGKPPGPMLDDYATLIASGAVSVVDAPGGITALIVLLPKSDHCCSTTSRYGPTVKGGATAEP